MAKMEALLQSVYQLVVGEYHRASLVHGERHNSPHEAYAVILEEHEEAVAEVEAVRAYLATFWESVRANDDDQSDVVINGMFLNAMNAAAEMIQVAAMAYKASLGYDKQIEEVEQDDV